MKPTVLIVDDEKIICQGLSRLLSNDYITYQASNGVEAIALIKKNIKIDIILCDILMPEMDGAEMIEKIRAKNKEVRIIVITAFSTPDKVFDAIGKGANAYMTKPVDIYELERLMKDTLQQKDPELSMAVSLP